MKKSWKRILGLVLAASLTFGGSLMAFADEAEEFNPDSADGIDFVEMREEFGAMPKLEDGLTVGCVIKQLQNNFWQSLKKGS